MVPLSAPNSSDETDDGGYTPETVKRALAAKDEGLISDKAYHELRMAFTGDLKNMMPPLSAIKSERKFQNDDIKIMQIPEVFYSFMMLIFNNLGSI